VSPSLDAATVETDPPGAYGGDVGPRTAHPVDRARPEDLLHLAVDKGGRVPMAIGALLLLDPDHQASADEVRRALVVRAASVVPAVPDPAVRRAAVVAQRARVAAPERGGSAAVLTAAFRALAAVRAFQPFIDHQRLVHTFVTIVRGPAHHLRVAGAEVAAVVPVAVNPGNVAVSFDVLSYAGTLVVTLVCDRGWCPSRRGCPTG
jgi:hypothetical protein